MIKQNNLNDVCHKKKSKNIVGKQSKNFFLRKVKKKKLIFNIFVVFCGIFNLYQRIYLIVRIMLTFSDLIKKINIFNNFFLTHCGSGLLIDCGFKKELSKLFFCYFSFFLQNFFTKHVFCYRRKLIDIDESIAFNWLTSYWKKKKFYVKKKKYFRWSLLTYHARYIKFCDVLYHTKRLNYTECNEFSRGQKFFFYKKKNYLAKGLVLNRISLNKKIFLLFLKIFKFLFKSKKTKWYFFKLVKKIKYLIFFLSFFKGVLTKKIIQRPYHISFLQRFRRSNFWFLQYWCKNTPYWYKWKTTLFTKSRSVKMWKRKRIKKRKTFFSRYVYRQKKVYYTKYKWNLWKKKKIQKSKKMFINFRQFSYLQKNKNKLLLKKYDKYFRSRAKLSMFLLWTWIQLRKKKVRMGVKKLFNWRLKGWVRWQRVRRKYWWWRKNCLRKLIKKDLNTIMWDTKVGLRYSWSKWKFFRRFYLKKKAIGWFLWLKRIFFLKKKYLAKKVVKKIKTVLNKKIKVKIAKNIFFLTIPNVTTTKTLYYLKKKILLSVKKKVLASLTNKLQKRKLI